jgi:glycosyltransferase involved in cell wall biosynthesis
MSQPIRTATLPPTLWQGGIFSAHSLARVNRELISALLKLDPYWQVHLIGLESGDAIENADQHPLRPYLLGEHAPPAHGWQVWVRHQFPPDWSRSPVPLAVIQPWEFGAAPREWVEQIRARNAQLWTPSRFVYETFLKSGVPDSQLRIVPNGVNPDQFRPDLPPLDLTQWGLTNVPRESLAHRYKFLFVGGSVRRKGIDVLLNAYRAAFRAGDEVLLIVKDFGVQDVYSTHNYYAQLMEWVRDSSLPPLLYIPETIPECDIARLYCAADCLVHPYRAEGFGLPIAEAMACARPVIVTGIRRVPRLLRRADRLPPARRDSPVGGCAGFRVGRHTFLGRAVARRACRNDADGRFKPAGSATEGASRLRAYPSPLPLGACRPNRRSLLARTGRGSHSIRDLLSYWA